LVLEPLGGDIGICHDALLLLVGGVQPLLLQQLQQPQRKRAEQQPKPGLLFPLWSLLSWSSRVVQQ
jgi:hypothetical protein